MLMDNNLLPATWKGRWSYCRLTGNSYVPMFPTISGPDWLSGGTYFIRNRRQPKIYWWAHDTHIHTSEQRRTKFLVRRETETGIPAVLNRPDKITVHVVAETVNSAAASKGTLFVAIRAPDSNCLHLKNTPHVWTFGNFINRDVGVRWGKEIKSEENEPEKSLLVYMTGGGGDEWELC
jgi:hypothetical protein